MTLLVSELAAPPRPRQALSGGGEPSGTLPSEYRPTPRHEVLFAQVLAARADRIALLTRVLARRIAREHSAAPVLVSLIRAGTPVGVLLRRALACDGIASPHYAISIVRGRGLDGRALEYVLARHPAERIVFVDGWTGTGTIRAELERALAGHARAHGGRVAPRLAVLIDPAHVTELCASREDELIPSACLNSTVSGLISRTVFRPDALHGVRVYREFTDRDASRRFLDTITARFEAVEQALPAALEAAAALAPADGRGLREATAAQAEAGSAEIEHVRPGIGETTRVLLRQTPRLVLIDPRSRERLAHVLQLSRERAVPVALRSSDVYACFAITA